MFEEDFSVYTDLDTPGVVTATIGTKEVQGPFDHEYVETTIGGVPVAGERPVFGCAESDLPPYTDGTEIRINSIVYKIRDWQPDGTGWINLILEKQ
jgi:hypothetical protein